MLETKSNTAHEWDASRLIWISRQNLLFSFKQTDKMDKAGSRTKILYSVSQKILPTLPKVL